MEECVKSKTFKKINIRAGKKIVAKIKDRVYGYRKGVSDNVTNFERGNIRYLIIEDSDTFTFEKYNGFSFKSEFFSYDEARKFFDFAPYK